MVNKAVIVSGEEAARDNRLDLNWSDANRPDANWPDADRPAVN